MNLLETYRFNQKSSIDEKLQGRKNFVRHLLKMYSGCKDHSKVQKTLSPEVISVDFLPNLVISSDLRLASICQQHYFHYIEIRIRKGIRIFSGLNLLLPQGDTKPVSWFASYKEFSIYYKISRIKKPSFYINIDQEEEMELVASCSFILFIYLNLYLPLLHKSSQR